MICAITLEYENIINLIITSSDFGDVQSLYKGRQDYFENKEKWF